MVDFSVRQLLLAALGATGSLLIDLTALAQLSSDTSTFSGVIAAMCVFDGLGNSYSMTYNSEGNHLQEIVDFGVITNSPIIRIDLGQINQNQEATPLNNASIRTTATLRQKIGNSRRWRAASSKSQSGTSLPIDISEGNILSLDTFVWSTGQVNNKYQLGPGEYSYSFTVSCLL